MVELLNHIPTERRLRWLERNGLPTDRGVVRGEDYGEFREDHLFSTECLDEYGYVRPQSLKGRTWQSLTRLAVHINYPWVLRFASGGMGGYVVNQVINYGLAELPNIFGSGLPGAVDSLVHSAGWTVGVVGGVRVSGVIEHSISQGINMLRRRLYI